MTESAAEFTVLDHFDLTKRGAFLVGRIESGEIRLGMRMRLAGFTVAEIEAVNRAGAGSVALRFAESPSVAELRSLYPLNATVRLVAVAT